MRYHLLTLLSVVALGLPLGVHGQVYETTDAEGNTVFTDVPPGGEAKTVDLDTTNIADSVEVRPPAPEPARRTLPEQEDAQAPEAPVYVDGYDDEVLYYDNNQREDIRERLEDGREPGNRPGVKPRPTPLPAHAPAHRPHRGR